MRKEQANVDELKLKILETSFQMFSTYGYSGTNLSDITDRLNITRTPLYYHYKNKKELYVATARWHTERKYEKYHEIWTSDLPLLRRIKDDLLICMMFGIKESAFFQESMTRVELSEAKQLFDEIGMRVFKLKYECFTQAKKEGKLAKNADIIYLIRMMYLIYFGVINLLELERVAPIKLTAIGGETEAFIDEIVGKSIAPYIIE